MHPAPSIILFSTLSGLGFGLLAFLGLGAPAPTGWVAFVFYAVAFALAVGGLISSTFHLGRPERAWRAFTQWRTSWLSREGCVAVAALLIMGIVALAQIFWDRPLPLLGGIGAVLCLITVFSTSMIYASLRTVPRWHDLTTPALFLAWSVAGGALLAAHTTLAGGLLLAALAIQIAHWLRGDTALRRSGTTLGTATGLTGGALRSFEPPHTGGNYLTQEMVFLIGRKHARNLRIIAAVLGGALPAALLLLAPAGHVVAGLALLSHLAGLIVTRWLFFAEAEHVVGLYYGAHRGKTA
ncbi:dimethyl sulfoxide reductase anchor subunit family protein [Aestuariibius insulae]|uniref:dimethyl sulfoxide reductase anchor subunit family protein n=1 Tax=Aestuariibius insulae TaxID=2058287 RepID=UPI00345E4319